MTLENENPLSLHLLYETESTLTDILQEEGYDINDPKLQRVIVRVVAKENEFQDKVKDRVDSVYQHLLNDSVDGFDVVALASSDPYDPDHRLIFRNMALRELFPDDKLYLTHEELSARFSYSTEEESRKLTNEAIKALLTSGYYKSDRRVTMDNIERHYVTTLQLSTISGQLIMTRQYRDVTEERLKEREITEQKELLRNILETLPGGVSHVDEEGTHLYVSPQVKEIFGSDTWVDVGTHAFDAFDFDSKGYMIEQANNLKDGGTYHALLAAKREDGSNFPLEIHVNKFKNQETDKYEYITYISDAREKVKQEKILKERTSLYEALLDHSFLGIDISEVKIEPHLGVVKMDVILRNGGAEKVFGPIREYKTEDLAKEASKILGQDKSTWGSQFKEFIENGIKLLEFDSEDIWGNQIKVRGIFRHIEVDDKSFLVRILDDITEESKRKKIISDQLVALKERQVQLEKYIESNLQLENFAYIASHDLKAPLRTVLSFSQLIKQSSYELLDDKDKEFLDIVINSSTNMMSLIEDLLTFSRVNTQKIKLDEIKLADLRATINIDLTDTIEGCSGQITWEGFDDSVMSADKTKMIQLFENLIRNALKFVKPGEQPCVHISHKENDRHHRFEIKDNGIGIPDRHLEKIFGIFEKLHSKDIYEGTGLGLAICAKIVEQHFGQIEVASEVGQGSTFSFTIAKNL